MNASLFLDARQHGGHTYWTTDKGIAVADRSMRKWGHPESTDEGLLIVDEEKLRDSEEYFQVIGSDRPTMKVELLKRSKKGKKR